MPPGTQIVLRGEVLPNSQSEGEVAVILNGPDETDHSYRVRAIDGAETVLRREQFAILKHLKAGAKQEHDPSELKRYIIYRCVVGSRAYGLDRDGSDTDRRGIYLSPAELQWSLAGAPEQIEDTAAQECFWELKKFLLLAVRANPNILECLFTPLIEESSEIADVLVAKRGAFLSKLVYQTYNGYVLSQFKRLEQDMRAAGEIKWKHAMHLIRLLLQGISVLEQAHVPVRVDEHREALLGIRDGQVPWAEVNRWRLALHRDFDRALAQSPLPDAPDYAEANRLLVWARRRMAERDVS